MIAPESVEDGKSAVPGLAPGVQPGPDGAAGSPSLVNIGQDRTWKNRGQWDRQQKRVFRTLQSWIILKASSGYQLFFVHFTGGTGADQGKLAEHDKELKKRVFRELGYKVDEFKVQTREGNGVLHCVWAVKSEQAVWISQSWLSEQWQAIHGAHRVWINRIKTSKRDLKNVANYVVNQYVAGQTSIVRCSYGWRTCKVALGVGWAQFKKLTSELRPIKYYEQFYGRDVAVRDLLPMADIVKAWQALLEVGWCMVDGVVFDIQDRLVYPKTYVVASFGDECPF